MATKDTGGQRQTTRRGEEAEESSAEASGEVKERQEKLADDVDAILDEIDEVLRRTPRSSSGPTSRRAGSDRPGAAFRAGLTPWADCPACAGRWAAAGQ